MPATCFHCMGTTLWVNPFDRDRHRMSALADAILSAPIDGVGGDLTGLTVQVCQRDRVADGVRRLVLRDPRGRRLPDWTPAHIST